MVRAFFCAGISRAVLFSNVREKFRPAREKENGEGPSPPAEASLHPEEIQGSPPPSKGGNSSEGRKGRKERRRVFCRPLLVGGEREKKSYRKRGYYLIILFSLSPPPLFSFLPSLLSSRMKLAFALIFLGEEDGEGKRKRKKRYKKGT